MTTRDDRSGGYPAPGGSDALDQYLDAVARGDAPDATPSGLDPALAATVDLLRDLDRPPGPDPEFVARLREDLTMDHPSITTATGGYAPSPTVSPRSPVPSGTRRPHYAPSSDADAAPNRRQAAIRSWNRRAWPVVELLGAAVLILGLVTVMTGGGSGWLPALLTGTDRDQASRQATTATTDAIGAVAMTQGDAGRSGILPGPGVDGPPELRWRVETAPHPPFNGYSKQAGGTTALVAGDTIVTRERRYVVESDGTQWFGNLLFARDLNGNVRWSAVWDGLSAGDPLIAAGVVVVATDAIGSGASATATPTSYTVGTDGRGALVAYDLQTGAERWRTTTGLVGYQNPVYADGVVYLIDQSGYARGFDVMSGTVRWTSPTIPPFDNGGTRAAYIPTFTSVTVSDEAVLVTSTRGATYAFSRAAGNLLWLWPDPDSTTAGTSITPNTAPPIASGDTAYLTVTDRGQVAGIVALDLTTGAERWTRDVGSYGFVLTAVVGDTLIYSTDEYQQAVIVALDTATGTEAAWEAVLPHPLVGSPTVVDDTVYIAMSSGDVQAFDIVTGERNWAVQAGGSIEGAVFVAGGTAYFTSTDGYLYAIGGAGSDEPTTSPLDVSGLPACDVTPLPDLVATPAARSGLQPVDGTPAATFATPNPGQNQFDPPVIGVADLPSGSPPDQEQSSDIAEMFNTMRSCARRDDQTILAAFYSNDLYRRDWARYHVEANASYPAWRPAPRLDTAASITESGIVLGDGRVAVLTANDGNDYVQYLIILTSSEGRWLIDELVMVTPTGEPLIG